MLRITKSNSMYFFFFFEIVTIVLYKYVAKEFTLCLNFRHFTVPLAKTIQKITSDVVTVSNFFDARSMFLKTFLLALC